MGLKLWYAKRLHRSLLKQENRLKKLKSYVINQEIKIKQQQIQLNWALKDLTKEEHNKFRKDEGYN